MRIVVSLTGSLNGVGGGGLVDALFVDKLRHSNGPGKREYLSDENGQFVDDSRDDDPISFEDLQNLFLDAEIDDGNRFI